VKKLILFLSLATLPALLFAQTKRDERQEKKLEKEKRVNEMVRKSEEGILIFNKQSIFGVQARTNGFGAFYELGRAVNLKRTNLYRIDITEIKDDKEEKLNAGFFGNSFVYGKINHFYQATLGYGQQIVIGQKGNKNGVAVTGLYYGGLALGLLRPYYLTVNSSSGARDVKYDSPDSLLFLDVSASPSGAGFGKGWNEITVKPGAFAKAALRFDFGRFNESITALEIGLSAEAYASKIPIMVDRKQKQLFVQGYVAFLFGRRR